MNLRDHASVRRAAETVLSLLGGVDVLINNALASTPSILADPDPVLSDWQVALRANLEGPFLITELLAPAMAERGWGRIVSISSDLAEKGSQTTPSYSTAKAGLHGMTRSLAWQLGPKGVLINVVLPGLSSTDRQLARLPETVFDKVRNENPTGRISTPQDVADLVVFLCSERNRNITGEFVRVTGGS
jgi:3-oxoacyl-[acyl-carrier protein] reductase